MYAGMMQEHGIDLNEALIERERKNIVKGVKPKEKPSLFKVSCPGGPNRPRNAARLVPGRGEGAWLCHPRESLEPHIVHSAVSAVQVVYRSRYEDLSPPRGWWGHTTHVRTHYSYISAY